MNEEKHSKDTSIEAQVLGYMLNYDFYGRVKNIITRDMFEGRYATVFDSITYGHKKYAVTLHPA